MTMIRRNADNTIEDTYIYRGRIFR